MLTTSKLKKIRESLIDVDSNSEIYVSLYWPKYVQLLRPKHSPKIKLTLKNRMVLRCRKGFDINTTKSMPCLLTSINSDSDTITLVQG